MKKLYIILSLLPLLSIAQQKSKSKPNNKTSTKIAVNKNEGFEIDATVTGFADGTKVELLNGQTGTPEIATTIINNKFSFSGKVNNPGFKIIYINKQPPYLTLFLDNSQVKINGDKETLDRATVTGSNSHIDFQLLNQSLQQYQRLFIENALYDSLATEGAKLVIETFVQQHPTSFVAPLALIRYNQVVDDITKTEKLFVTLPQEVQASEMGAYLSQLIAEGKRNAIGTLLEDFIQNDTEGKPVSLSSFRGKYVLIDFWASWCRPCRQENPNVVENYNKFKNKNFTVLGVSLDKAKPAWVEAIGMDGLTWSHVSDLQGWSNAVAQQFKIQSIPQNILIGPDGKIIAKNLRGPDLEAKLSKLLR